MAAAGAAAGGGGGGAGAGGGGGAEGEAEGAARRDARWKRLRAAVLSKERRRELLAHIPLLEVPLFSKSTRALPSGEQETVYEDLDARLRDAHFAGRETPFRPVTIVRPPLAAAAAATAAGAPPPL